MRSICRWLVLAVAILGASCGAHVGWEQHTLAVAADAGPILAEGTSVAALRAPSSAPTAPARTRAVARAAPMLVDGRSFSAPSELGESMPSSEAEAAAATREILYRPGAMARGTTQAGRSSAGAVLGVAGDAAPVLSREADPVVAPTIADEGAGKGVRRVIPEPVRSSQDGGRLYEPGPTTLQGRYLVTDAWSGSERFLLVEDVNRYWLMDWAAGQPARSVEATAEFDVSPSGGGLQAQSDRPSADAPASEASSAQVGLQAPRARHLLVDQAAQMMYVYEGEIEIRALPVSTGLPTSKTLTRAWVGSVGQDLGAATVDGGMYVDQAWYLFPDLFGNILLHTVPYVQQGTLRVYDQPEALGVRPSSHGCVRMSPEDAQWLREWGPVGVPIEITEPVGPIRRVG